MAQFTNKWGMGNKNQEKTIGEEKMSAKKPEMARKSTLTSSGSGDLFSLIQKKAYELYTKRGYSHGNDQTDWYEAEKIVLRSLKK
ncbi:MAG: DUF2934 domain-containing protein [Candidatus Omnitrophica bacterium]|nr:DUF2934 domain-containing protein [Candidatus Omnitrophota bacterium]